MNHDELELGKVEPKNNTTEQKSEEAELNFEDTVQASDETELKFEDIEEELDAPELEFEDIEAELEETELNFEDIETELEESALEFDDIEAELEEAELKSEGSEQELTVTVLQEYAGYRIDKYLSEVLSALSRSYLQKLIDEGRVFVSDKPVKANLKVKAGQLVTLYVPEPKEAEIVAEDLSLDIIYEDKDIIIINKQKGMVVHPAAGHATGTLVNALMYHCKGELSGINGVLRPGIVHRIDRDTTGVIVACKNDKSHQFIAEQLKEHSITRRYQAIVYHPFKTEGGRVEAPIGRHEKDRKKMSVNHKNGKFAATNYQVIENLNNKYAYIECSLETGRTHQIRVHMASIHHPLLGDTVYGPEKDPFHLEGQALHAGVLGFIHPSSKEYVEFSAPLPRYFTDLLEKLR